jgi:hypothetical protein
MRQPRLVQNKSKVEVLYQSQVTSVFINLLTATCFATTAETCSPWMNWQKLLLCATDLIRIFMSLDLVTVCLHGANLRINRGSLRHIWCRLNFSEICTYPLKFLSNFTPSSKEISKEFSSTSVLYGRGGVFGQGHVLADYLRERDPALIVHDVGWVSRPVWTVAENLATTGIRSPDRPARNDPLYTLHAQNISPVRLTFSRSLCTVIFYALLQKRGLIFINMGADGAPRLPFCAI